MVNADMTGDGARELLRDAFSRVREHVDQICHEVSPAQATYRPDPDANTIMWLIWHLTRIQDDHLSGLTGEEQLWTREGWYDRFDLPFDPRDHGYGHTSAEVGMVNVPLHLLDEYQSAVHDTCLAYVDNWTLDELARVVDANWDPPVTAAVRLVSILGDCLEHLGQANYVRGLAQRAGISPESPC
jgi:Protein of unknown function (DUF664)